MFGNGQIIISHTHDDNQRCQPLLAALDAWQTDYWFDPREWDDGERFSEQVQQALDTRDIFVRVSTPAAERSFWMDRELRAVRGLRSAFPEHPRLIIHLVLSGSMSALTKSAGTGEVVIDATRTPRSLWMQELRRELGAVAGRRVSRRTAVAAGAASMVAVATAGVAAKIFLTPSHAMANPFHPNNAAHPAAIEPGALPVRWHKSLNFSASELAGYLSENFNVGMAADDTAVYAISPTSLVVVAMSLRDSSILWFYPDQSRVPRVTVTGYTIATTPASTAVFILSQVFTPGSNPLNPTISFNLMAVEKASGKLLWKSPNLSSPDLFSDRWSGLCLTDSAIFFQLDGKLYGYTQAGEPLWPPLTMFVLTSTSPVSFSMSAPAFAGGLLFVATLDGRLLAVESATAALSWSVQLATVATGEIAPIQASPATAGELVYVGASDGYCYALNASSGSLAWKTQLINAAAYNTNSNPGFTALMGSVTVGNDVIYLQAAILNQQLTFEGTWLFALDANTGKQLWKVDPTELRIPLPPSLSSSIVCIASVAPWYPTGDLIYTTLSFTSSTLDTDVAAVQVLVALNRQDGSLHSYFWAPVDGENLGDGYAPPTPAPVPGGMAFMTNEPQVYVLNL